MMMIVLASGSARRRELLTQAQVAFDTISIDIDESLLADETPTNYIKRMVKDKSIAAIEVLNTALNVSSSLDKSTAIISDSVGRDSKISTDSLIVLTADTIGVLPDKKTVLTKPKDYQQACTMWRQMSDSTHQVWTAVRAIKLQRLLLDNGCMQWQMVKERQIIERTEVSFIPLSLTMMQEYWDSGEPADKAGGYGIQGLAAAWVTRINGSYTNVVGLPLAQTLNLIEGLKD